MAEDTVYKSLIEHQRGWVFGMPEHEALLPLLKKYFTPEEAALCAQIPHLPKTAEELSGLLRIPVGELTGKLDDFSRRGILQRSQGRDAIHYALMDAVFWFYRASGWAGRTGKWNRDISTLLNRYYIDSFADAFVGLHTKGLRAIPIGETITDTHVVLPYEDIVQIIDQVSYYTVSVCPCRHRKNLDPDSHSCSHETLNCLHFDRLGHYIVENDMGKEITREETLEILASAADAGLVHGISNTKTKMDTICNCCSCCCLFLESTVNMAEPVPRGHQPSNYIVHIQKEVCKACGLCARRCPMGALKLKDTDTSAAIISKGMDNSTELERKGKDLVFNPERCLGCGVCVHKCTGGALSLIQRDEEHDIPISLADQGQRMMMEQGLDPMDVFQRNS